MLKIIKSKRIIFAFVSSFILIISLISYWSFTSFSYTDEMINAANNLASRNIINNHEDNPDAYNLGSKVLRQEIAAVSRALAKLDKSTSCKNLFSDISQEKPNDWACLSVEPLLEKDLIAKNKNFRPEDKITKSEALWMLIKSIWFDYVYNPDDSKTWQEQIVEYWVSKWAISDFKSYNEAATRGWIFEVADKLLKIDEWLTDNRDCLQVITYAINPVSWECVSFNNSCIPAWWETTDTCEWKELQYEKDSFEILFNKNMDKDSIESNLKIYPEIKNQLVWKDAKTLRVELSESIDKETDFLVNISKEAKYEDGKNIEDVIVKKFKVTWTAKVDFVSPEWEITDLTKNITVRFSKPIVALTNFDNMEKCPIEITPNIEWKCLWITTSTFQFRPKDGFPIWADYTIHIPSWIETISWDKTANSKTVNIKTPQFKIINHSSKLNKDDKLIISFNSDISLDDFKQNFQISWFSNEDLNISYYEYEDSYWNKSIKKNMVSIFPKNSDWWYWNNYDYTIKSWLKSERWNVPLWKDSKYNLKINELLINHVSFVYRDLENQNKYLISNLRKSYDDYIIPKTNPNILLTFYEDIELDKNIIKIDNYDYNLKYAQNIKNIDWEKEIYEDKKQVIIEVLWFNSSSNNKSALKVSILASKISNSKDIIIDFSTQEENKILSYKMLDYKTSCLKTKNPLNAYDNINYKYFDFWDKSKIYYISQISKYSNISWCPYEAWKNTYSIETTLNPDEDYELIIDKNLYDRNNYTLDKNYNFSFHTNKALNEDKYVKLIDSRDFILVPKDLSPLWVSISTINLDKVSVEICKWDLDLTNLDYIKSSKCQTKEIEINNLWFNPNISVLDLESILWEKIDKSILTLKVSKLDSDKTEAEKTPSRYYWNDKSHYIFSDNSIVLKTDSKQSSVWLSSFKTWENLENKIKNISLYNRDDKYSKFWEYGGSSMKFVSNISFSNIWDWLYDLKSDLQSWYLLFELTSWEKMILSVSWYMRETANLQKTYITTDAPLYKPWSKVKLKWTSRIQTATDYKIDSSNVTLYIRDPNYKYILDWEIIKQSQDWSFEFEFELDKEASLWNYSIEASSSYWTSYLNFSVEEYEKPDFKVESNPKKDIYYYPENAQIELKADYYVGSPLSNANWTYNVYASDYYFDWWKTTWYIWGKNDSYYWWWNYRGNSQKNIAYNQSFILDEKWQIILDINSSDTITDKIYNVSSTITDPSTKKSLSTDSSFKLLNSKTFAWIKFDKYYYNYWDTAKIDFVTTDIEWNKIWSKDLKLSVYKIDYKYDKNLYTYNKEEKLLKEEDLSSNSWWKWIKEYKFEDYWEYRIELALADWKYKTTKTIYISWYNLLRREESKHDLVILKNKEKYNIWDNAELVIQSPTTWVKALVTIEKMWKVLKKEIIEINSNSQIYNFEVKKEYLPNVEFKAFIIENTDVNKDSYKKLESIRKEMIELEEKLYADKEDIIIPYYYLYSDIVNKNWIWLPIYKKDETIDKDLLEQLVKLRAEEQENMANILPSYYSWKTDIKLNLDSIKLDSSVEIDKVSYLPWDSQEIVLNIKDNNWNPISWEAMISVIDESLLALKNNDVDITNYFYSDVNNSNYLYFNLNDIIKRFDFADFELQRKLEIEDDYDFWNNMVMSDSVWWAEMLPMNKSVVFDDYEISDKGSIESNSTKLRTEFKDVAFYKWVVKVVNWKATINVPKLPDNLTTWIIKGYTITPDTKVWSFQKDFKVQKQLNLLPSIPRFFIVWDEAEISAIVVNNSNQDLDIKSTLEADNLEIIWEQFILINIKANSQDLVSFKVKIKDKPKDISWNEYKTTIMIKAESWNLLDSLQVEKNIIAYSTPEYTFTNGSTYDLSYEDKIFLPNYIDKDFWQLDISLWASILTNLTDSINNIASNPGNNFYSTLSSMKTASILKWLYKSIWEEQEYYKIEVIDYLWNKNNLNELIIERIKDIEKFQNSDWAMMYYIDCAPRYTWQNCSNFNLTWEFLSTAKKMKDNWYQISPLIVDKALRYYKSELEKIIKEYERNWSKYRNIDSFYKILWYDNEFLKKYVIDERFIETDDYKFDNISKLKLILIMQDISKDNILLEDYINDIKNSTIIEARWTLLPANNWSKDNTVSTALALKVFINDLSDEKLVIENMARWLIQQKNQDWYFWSRYETSEIIESLNLYVNYTKELENINFTWKWYLNSKEIINASFGSKNKFENINKSYSLKDYINFWEYNSLWFEKTWSWKLYYDVWLRYFLPIEQIDARDEWIIVNRNYYNYEDYKVAFKKECYNFYFRYDYYGWYANSYYPCEMKKVKDIREVNYWNKGDYLVWEIEIIVPSERNNVLVNNYIPAWAEILNVNLDTTGEDVKDITLQDNSSWRWFDHIENKDEQIVLYADRLYKWTYKYTYVIQLNHKWIYHHRPAIAEEMKKPEIWGRSKWEFFEIK